jgi:DNA polymerase-3 subunit gamma/tau
MSYIPLHHKYRPQTFADLVGQEAIARALSNAISSKQIAPAYLFTGARGTGKTSSARIMAKALNCLSSDAPTPNPCGVCEMCRTIAKGTALDVTEIDAASNTGVDNIRELIERAQFAPAIARYKVYIIDECHMLSGAAFNALLKTLEEPPERVVFILATTDPQRVLPTIISRCQKYDFRRIPLGAMVKHLGAIAKKENININADALLLVAQIAQGGLRDAESLLDQLSLLDGAITPEVVWDLVGTVPERDLLALLEYISQGDVIALLANVRRILDRGREPLILLQNLAMIYRDLLIAKMTTEKSELISLSDQGWQKLQILAQSFSTEQIISGQQQLRSAEVQLKNTTQPRLWLEVTLCELLSGLGKQEVVANPQKVATNVSSAPQPAEVIPSQTIAKNDDPVTLWQNILAKLSPPTRALFVSNLNAVISEVRDREILIGIPDPKDDAKKKEKSEIAKQRRPEIEIAAKEVLGRSMQIRYKFVAGLKPLAPINPAEMPSVSPQDITKEFILEKKAQPAIDRTLPVAKPSFANTPEDIALKNIVDLFGGQVISLDEETTDSSDN